MRQRQLRATSAIPTIAVVTSRGRPRRRHRWSAAGGPTIARRVRAGDRQRQAPMPQEMVRGSGIVVGSSRRASSSTLTSRRVMTRTLATNRAGRNMSHTQASIRSTCTQPPSRCVDVHLVGQVEPSLGLDDVGEHREHVAVLAVELELAFLFEPFDVVVAHHDSQASHADAGHPQTPCRSRAARAGPRTRTTAGGSAWARGDRAPPGGRGCRSPVVVEPELGVAPVHAVHDPVPGHLGHDRGGCHAGGHRVALLDRRATGTGSRHREPVGEHVVGLGLQGLGGAAQQRAGCTGAGHGGRSSPGSTLAHGVRPRRPRCARRPSSRWLRSASSSRGSRPGRSPSGRITAAATIGPASAPRPASSTPAIRREPLGAEHALVAVEVVGRQWIHPIRDGRPDDDEGLADHLVIGHVAQSPFVRREPRVAGVAADCRPT